MSRRIFAQLGAIRPLAGLCPACNLPLDALGCRIVSRTSTTRAMRRRTGIAESIEVLCNGTPTAPLRPCPCCAGHPVAPHRDDGTAA